MSRGSLAGIVVGYVAVLALIASARYSAGSDSPLAAVAPHATWLYVVAVVFAAISLGRAGVESNRLGFGTPLRASHVGLALAAVVLLQSSGWLLEPVWAGVFGEGRDLTRFSGVSSDSAELAGLLLLSWTFAAFGEELAFRILLQRSIAVLLGDSARATAVAVVLQALVFGAVHAYQGPVGVLETTFSGLVYGTVTALARYAIWPAALAHGTGNSIGLITLYYSGS